MTRFQRNGGREGDDGTNDLEPVVVPITDAIDLHDFHPREVLEVVDAYLEAAQEKGFREVRLIHGRGKGVQRAQIHALLNGHPLVASIAEAPADRGGWGATLVVLNEIS